MSSLATGPIEINGRIFTIGMDRNEQDAVRSHLYLGEPYEIKGPMCAWGYNREGGAISIFRSNTSSMGICKICEKRAARGDDIAKWRGGKRKWI